MKFSEKMGFIIILNVTKNRGFTLSLEDTFFEKQQGGQIDPPSILWVKHQGINFTKPRLMTSSRAQSSSEIRSFFLKEYGKKSLLWQEMTNHFSLQQQYYNSLFFSVTSAISIILHFCFKISSSMSFAF